jgi:DNA polymerase I-like protein with 3'-5' exonuclease and polymerase domains
LLNSPTKLVSVVNKVLKSKGIEIDNFQSKTLEKVLKTIQQTTEEEIIEEDKDDFWIEEYKFDVDLINNLIQYKKLSKLLSTDYEDIINPVTLNLHSHFNPNGTSTGRMSSSGSKRGGFNAQQITTKTFDIGDYSQEQFFNSQSKILI